MASAKAIALMESIYKRVDQQVRDIMATLPGVTVPAQQDGSVVSAQRRIYNFQGPGVVVTDDPSRSRVNVFIPGSPATDPAASVFISTVGVERVFPLGTAPANWWLPAFVDSGWGLSVLESSNIAGSYTVAPTAAWITETSINGDNGTTDTQFLTRRSFTLPAGSITSATLDINYDDDVGLDSFGGGDGSTEGMWINGHLIGALTRTGTPRSYAIFPIPISWLNTGASNVLAASVFSQAGANALSYRVTVNMTTAGADPLYQLFAERGDPSGYAGLDADGLVADAALADSGTPSSTTFLRGDRSWSAASTNSVTIQDIDGAPTVTATVLEFPNGTLSDQGGGVARYTAAAPGTVPYVNIQDQKASGTSGGTFTSGAWQTRTLNTVQSDSDAIASLASNQITLPAGTYECRISCPAGEVAYHQARLQNITDTATILSGTSEHTQASVVAVTNSVISGRFTLAASKALEVQHRCGTTRATQGFGVAAGASFTVATEVYTIAEFRKVA